MGAFGGRKIGIGCMGVLAVVLSACSSPVPQTGGSSTSSGVAMDAMIACVSKHLPSSIASPAPEYVGLTLIKATELAKKSGVPILVVAKDGDCLGTSADLQVGRVDVIVLDGVVEMALSEHRPA